MNKENCTKGPIDSRYRFNDRSDKAIEVTNQERTPVATVHRGFIPQQEQEANAELIAEAFNVLHETGMTPRELAEAVQELRGACSEALSDMQPPDEGGLTGAEHDAGGGEGTIIRLKALLSKYQPVTPEA